jgi:hypothetical protein
VGYKTWLFHHHLQQQNPNNLKNHEKHIKYLDLLITLKWGNTSRLDPSFDTVIILIWDANSLLFSLLNIVVNGNLWVAIVDHAIELLVVLLEKKYFYATLVTYKCTPICKKLDCNAKNEPPYLAATLNPNYQFLFRSKYGQGTQKDCLI